MNQSAITMLQKTIEFMSKETCIDLMSELITPLITVKILTIVFLFERESFPKGVGHKFP